MGIRAIVGRTLPSIFRSMGEDAVFNPAAGDPVTCKVFIEFGVRLQPMGVDVQVPERGTVIEALLIDPSGATGIAIGREPLRGETFVVDGVTYTVRTILENDGLSVKAQVT